MTWHYSTAGQQTGPITHEELIGLIATGGLGPDDLVRGEGMEVWHAARGVPGLFSPPEADGAVAFEPGADAAAPTAAAIAVSVVTQTVPGALPGHEEPGFFSLAGRANQRTFFLQNVGLFFAWALGAVAAGGIGIPFGWFFVTLACMVCWAFPAVRRLHDMDYGGWVVFASYIPLLGLVVAIALFFVQGTVGPNRYGPEPVAAPSTPA